MKLHLFNPENDLALAADIEYYTPPAAARRMAAAGELYPLWFAEPGDAILVGSAEVEARGRELSRRFDLGVEVARVAPQGVDECVPWGWSRYARRRFINAGVPSDILPSDDTLTRYRRLSSRLTSIPLAEAMGLEPPVVATTQQEALAAVAANRSRGLESYIKMPWSCSGRGVFASSGMSTEQLRRRTANIIRAQDCAVIEPDRRRRADFAALYDISNGRARFIALSSFATDSRGAYLGNIVAPDSDIIHSLGVDPSNATTLAAHALTAVIGSAYTGRVGIDMVVTTDGQIYPLIELNLRTTMGHVAAALRPFLPPSTIVGRPNPARGCEDFFGSVAENL